MYGVGRNAASAAHGCANVVIAWMQRNDHASYISLGYTPGNSDLVCKFDKVLNSYKLSEAVISTERRNLDLLIHKISHIRSR